ncbi:MAG: hypothetical protein ACM3PW_06535 [Chlamydiota bacterium]
MRQTRSLFSPSGRLSGIRKRGLVALALTAVLMFILIGLIYNAAGILQLPQSRLKTFEIVWVSVSACVLVIMLAMAIATGVEHLGEALMPKARSEEWAREEVRHHRMAGMEVATPGAGKSRTG